MYLTLVEKLYDRIPDISISTDIMAGFPDENESDFEQSLDLIEKAAFSKVHIFGFSPRQGTPAASMSAQVDPASTKSRIERLKVAAGTAAVLHRQKFVGTTQEILTEKKDKDHCVAEGFTNNYLRCKAIYTKDSGIEREKGVFCAKIEKSDETMLYGNAI